MREWSTAEDDFLRRSYGKEPLADLCGFLLLDDAEVMGRAGKLGLVAPRGGSWHPYEDRHLRFAWGHRPASRIGLELGRSKSAVLGRARRLGLSAKGSPAGMRPWTEAEDAHLRRLLMGPRQYPSIGRDLGRSADSVCSRVTRLGWTSMRLAPEEAAMVRDLRRRKLENGRP